MRLHEIIRELIQRKFKTQTALAEALNPMPEGVERAKPADVQRMVRAGRNQEKQFAIFMKLLPLCKELGIDPAQDLKAPTDLEVLKHVESNGKKARRDEGQGKKRNEKAATRTVPPRRPHGTQGKETRQD